MSAETPQRVTRDVLGLAFSVLICFAAAGVGSMVTIPRIPNWYADLVTPDWTPPGWVFGPVWSILYVMMAVAAWMIWREHGFQRARIPLSLFGIQLVLNSVWSVLFFGFQRPGAAAVEITFLWIAILATLLAFWRRTWKAGVLLVPYLAWVSFAVALNIAIWRINR